MIIGVGIVILVVSLVGMFATNYRTRMAIKDAGGDPDELDRYWYEGGPPRWVSQVALLSYVGIAIGVVLIVVGLL